MKDLGERAAGRAPPETQPPLLLSRATLKPETLRRADAKISFHATRVDVGRVSLGEVSARAALDRGLLDVTSIEAKMLGGTLHGRLRLDANHDLPPVEVDLRVAKLALDQIHRKEGAPPAIEGPLNLHVAVHGRGTSVHEVAATSDGIVTAVVPRGTMRDSLAELTGLDLRGLGLLLAKDKHETELRCAAAVFQDHEGTLTALTFVADTEPVLIKAEGAIRFDNETLDLQIHGEPKSLRLFRWRSPLELSGTLSHPAVRLAAHQLKIVDPGNAKDADCAALIAGAEQAEPR
jgi:uncharacterized protein involved in outer membrane biogenesis